MIIMTTTEIITGKVRLSYVHLFKPYAREQGQEEKYSCVILLPKYDVKTKEAIDAAINAAIEKGVSDCWNGQRPPRPKTPIWDGDGLRENGEEFGPECKGHWVFTASAKVDRAPEIVGPDLKPIIDQADIYSGVYARVWVNFYPYNYSGKKGIGCGLGPVQKLGDGDVLGGAPVKASSVFGAVQIDPITGEVIL